MHRLCNSLMLIKQIPGEIPSPYALELAGNARAAAAEWAAIGCPYEQALALARMGEADAVAEATRILESLGAAAAVRAIRRR